MDISLVTMMVTYSLTTIAILVKLSLKCYRLKLDETIKLKLKQVLRMLVYDKLAISDSYFLDNSDNNIIYKVFYDDFLDYTSYSRNYCGIIGSLFMCVSFGIKAIVTTDHATISFFTPGVSIILILTLLVFVKSLY